MSGNRPDSWIQMRDLDWNYKAGIHQNVEDTENIKLAESGGTCL